MPCVLLASSGFLRRRRRRRRRRRDRRFLGRPAVLHLAFLDLRWLGVFAVLEEVLAVPLHQVGVPADDQDVLGVLVLRLVGEVIAAGHEHLLVDDDDLVVRNRVIVIDVGLEPLFDEDV